MGGETRNGQQQAWLQNPTFLYASQHSRQPVLLPPVGQPCTLQRPARATSLLKRGHPTTISVHFIKWIRGYFTTGSTFTSLRSCYSTVREVEGYVRACVHVLRALSCIVYKNQHSMLGDFHCVPPIFFFIFVFNWLLEASDTLDLDL